MFKKNVLCVGLELDMLVHRGKLPHGAVTLSSEQAQLDIQMETAAGHPSSYPGKCL